MGPKPKKDQRSAQNGLLQSSTAEVCAAPNATPSKATKDERLEHLQADHELFLQAFEKPTQIYRYLRTRHMISPIFLNRSLTFMRNRMASRLQSGRSKWFRVNSMLEAKLKEAQEAEPQLNKAFMTLTFLGYYEKKRGERLMDKVSVELLLVKVYHKKRKDAASQVAHVALGTCEVPVNPSEDHPPSKAPALSIPSESFSLTNGHLVKCFSLLVRLHRCHPSFQVLNGCSSSSTSSSDVQPQPAQVAVAGVGPQGDENQEPPCKRRKLLRGQPEESSKTLQCELVIYDKHSRCLLTEGEYELVLSESSVVEISPSPQSNDSAIASSAIATSSGGDHRLVANGIRVPSGPNFGSKVATNESASTAKTRKSASSSWETVNLDKADQSISQQFEVFKTSPTLKFRLSWSNEAAGSMVERPRPLMPRDNSQDLACVRKDRTRSSGRFSSSNGSGGSSAVPMNGISSAHGGHSNGISGNGNRSGGGSCCSSVSGKSAAAAGNRSTTLAAGAASVTGFGPPMIGGGADKPPRIVYQFLYNNNSRQQTEARDDLHCPWCSLNCLELFSLLKHLKLSHPRFLFTYVPIQEGARIDVSVSELYDSTYVGNPHDMISQPPCHAFSRNCGPVQRTSITNVLVCKPKRAQPSLSEFLEIEENDLNGPYDGQRPFVTGHNRLYHYSTTNLPMPPHAILHPSTEDQVDPPWLMTKICRMIDEFSDVNEGEKELMKMWNLHVQHYTFVGDCQMSQAIRMFVEEKGRDIVERRLFRNFLLHLSNMFEFGVLSPGQVFTAVTRMQQFIRDHGLQSHLAVWNDQMRTAAAASKSAGANNSGTTKNDTGSRTRRRDFSGIFRTSEISAAEKSPEPLQKPEDRQEVVVDAKPPPNVEEVQIASSVNPHAQSTTTVSLPTNTAKQNASLVTVSSSTLGSAKVPAAPSCTGSGTGATTLPLSSSTSTRSNKSPEKSAEEVSGPRHKSASANVAAPAEGATSLASSGTAASSESSASGEKISSSSR